MSHSTLFLKEIAITSKYTYISWIISGFFFSVKYYFHKGKDLVFIKLYLKFLICGRKTAQLPLSKEKPNNSGNKYSSRMVFL